MTDNAHLYVPIAVRQADVYDVLSHSHIDRFVWSKIGREIVNGGLVESDVDVAVQTNADFIGVVACLQRSVGGIATDVIRGRFVFLDADDGGGLVSLLDIPCGFSVQTDQ